MIDKKEIVWKTWKRRDQLKPLINHGATDINFYFFFRTGIAMQPPFTG
jgi:hypothetical protein